MLSMVNVASGKGQLLWLLYKPSGKTSNLLGSGELQSSGGSQLPVNMQYCCCGF